MKKIGLIGVGGISDWHVRAFKNAGLCVSCVASRADSKRVEPFAEKHDIGLVYPSWEKLLEEASIDGVVIATHVDGSAAVLSAALKSNLPVLIEKPVVMDSAWFDQWSSKENVMVGYNRRFYRTVRYCKEFVEAGAPLVAQMSLPEGINWSDSNKPYLYPYFENSCHGIDMLNFIFGRLQIKSTSQITNGEGQVVGFGAVLHSQRGDVVQLSGNWGAPGNFSLTLDRPGRRVELKPFELVTIYEGMQVLEPNDEFPIRRYIPKAVDKILLDEIDLKEKPGFVKQAEAFLHLIETGKIEPGIATLDDARADVKLLEDLIGKKYSAHLSLVTSTR